MAAATTHPAATPVRVDGLLAPGGASLWIFLGVAAVLLVTGVVLRRTRA